MSATATRPEIELFPSQTAFFNGHYSRWRISGRTFLVEQLRAGERAAVRRELRRNFRRFRFAWSWNGCLFFCRFCFTAGMAIYIWLRGKSNVSAYPWVGNWLYHDAAIYRADCVCLHRMASCIRSGG